MVRFFQLAAAMILAMSSFIAVNAFHASAPSSQRSTSLIFPGKMISGASFRQQKHYGKLGSMELQMSSDGDDSSEKSKAVISADGTFYDDEMDSAPQKDGISNSMKERLMREASTGLDSDQKQPNVILYISLAIALLAVLGGAGIFY